MDKFDFFHLNDKKKLPGERKEMFPEGVPGVTQGIPPEYLKSNQPPVDTAQAPGGAAPAAAGDKTAAPPTVAKTAAVEPAPEPRAESETEAQAEAADGGASGRADHRTAGRPKSRQRPAAAGALAKSGTPAAGAGHRYRPLALRAAARHVLALTPLSG